MPSTDHHVVRPDAKGRVALGALAKGISSFHLKQDKKGRIILEPYIEVPANIPEREKWLYRNPEALKAVLQGLEDSAAGRVHNLGSFSHYLDDED